MADVWLALAITVFIVLICFEVRALPFAWLVGAMAGRVRSASLPAAISTCDNTVDFWVLMSPLGG